MEARLDTVEDVDAPLENLGNGTAGDYGYYDYPMDPCQDYVAGFAENNQTGEKNWYL